MVSVYSLVLALLHVVHASFLVAQQIWASAKRRLAHPEEPTVELYHVVQGFKKVKKLPKHLVVVLGREEPSFRDIVRIISWCATAEIPYVSFYDYEGSLKKSEGVMRNELEKLRPDLSEHISWNSTCPIKAARKDLTGLKYKVHVQLLDYLDGKAEVASLTRSLGEGVIAGALKIEEINQELLEDKLELGGIPDPDLALVCGTTCATYGLLPWHIRVTAFLLLPTHHNVTVTNFVNLLETYANCRQRYGQ